MFTATDPLDGIPGEPTLTNPYHYAANDPINRTDPSGLTPFTDDGFGSPGDDEVWQAVIRVLSPPSSRVSEHCRCFSDGSPLPPGWDTLSAAERHAYTAAYLGLVDPRRQRCGPFYGSCSELGWDVGKSNTNFWAGFTDRVVLDTLDFVTPGIDVGRIGVVYEGNHVEAAYRVGQTTGIAVEAISAGAGAIAIGRRAATLARNARSAPRGVLPTPEVSSTKLQNIVNDLYKGTTNPGRVGTGTTADALRYELRTRNSVFGKSHLQKAEDSLRGLENWLKANPNAPYHDRLVARSLADDLLDALRRSQ